MMTVCITQQSEERSSSRESSTLAILYAGFVVSSLQVLLLTQDFVEADNVMSPCC